jgi:hypothetical protein
MEKKMSAQKNDEPTLKEIMLSVLRITKTTWVKPHMVDEFVQLYADYLQGFSGTEILSGISYHMASYGKVPMPDEIPPAIAKVKQLGWENTSIQLH